ncbi:MAG TPA: hypothetical protein VFZ77_21785, partial [Acidimicrobiales bacterium]
MKRGVEATTTVHAPFEGVRTVLSEEPAIVMAGDLPAPERRSRQFRSDLGVDLPTGGAIRKAVDIEVGPLESANGTASVRLSWRASGRDRLFPVFDGHLEIRPEGNDATRLRVHGTYTVPLGPVGRFGDGLVGRRIARQSFESFLEDTAARLDAEVHRRSATV